MISWSPRFPRFGSLEPWQRSQYIVVMTVALEKISSDLTQPFLALYVQYLGVTDPAEASFWSGLALASGPIGSLLMGPIWGAMADRFGPKAMLLRAMVMIMLLQFAQGLAPDVRWLVAFRLLHGMFAGFSAMALALAISLGPRSRMGHVIGLVHAAEVVPNTVGPLLGGFISDHFGIRTNFFVTGSFLIVPIVVLVFLVPGVKYDDEHERPSAKAPAGLGAWRSYLLIPGFAATLAVMFAVRFSDKGLPAILPLYLAQLNTPEAQLATITGLVASTGAVAVGASAAIYGHHSRPANTRTLLVLALGGGAACAVLLGLARSWEQVLVLRFGLGLLAGGGQSLGYTIGARLAPSDRAGLTLAILASFGQMGSASAPLLAGLLGGVGLQFVFFAIAVAYLGALALALVITRGLRW
jgi:DHA1 family multidrug resistance protein-like MFS transporter